MQQKRWTDKEFSDAVKRFTSLSQVIKYFMMAPAGANFLAAKRDIKRLNLDTSHFTGKGHLKGKSHDWAHSTPLEEILVKNSRHYLTSLSKLKERLLKAGLLTYKCSLCSIESWLSKPLSLHLDHINGDRFDNSLENLRLLCPNCHSQTDTYCGKNKKRK